MLRKDRQLGVWLYFLFEGGPSSHNRLASVLDKSIQILLRRFVVKWVDQFLGLFLLWRCLRVELLFLLRRHLKQLT